MEVSETKNNSDVDFSSKNLSDANLSSADLGISTAGHNDGETAVTQVAYGSVVTPDGDVLQDG